MREISINNGRSFCEPEEAIATVSWDIIVRSMRKELRELIHIELFPCSEICFLRNYLDLAEENLIIG